ncbi:type II inositol-1,4,5-trisphosphate 5-phosphatase [Colletotrichum tofieldiae]|uniref:Type II inositol-1,4,5-trisphosphate 5-phosphatase n=1 Tax=Colletotrichum tofieldiae TaxID=708197 RepID=A0A161YJX5_9PEZI|nr:type II inositol-1,4,5-trisphosphate 5-phosphatase [Colletotrichum tofieldiae]GKT67001.1 type II inositol-1,4,5-trisphosphate 5-phosphatase [Colletotrichum tofieldiae]GKT80397.1 type II inositol-1,4,5-trisphosphate 5-phosphatase [Colletotrichum tofieldiae]GKT94748.1 type II inositol-1,4,5-trisphosphate 5-phosphatase [Colletotrichum tofieldiae]
MSLSETIPSTTSDPVDLTSTPHSLARAVYARRAEYVRPHRIRVKIGTWNVAACPGTDKDLASWFVDGYGLDTTLSKLDVSDHDTVETNPPPATKKGSDDQDPDASVHLVGGDKIGLYVLGLQEIVDLNMARDYMNRMSSDPAPMKKWKEALEEAMPEGYDLVAAEQMSGLLLLAYASPEVAPTVSNVSTVSVGTGLFGYLGNKGAVTTRMLLGETTRMVFVNCHLASGAEQTYLDRRLWDVGQIMTRTQFDPINLAGENDAEAEKIGDEDFAFWLGDLNFRVDGLPGNDIRRLLLLHTRGEYDLDKKGRKVIAGEEVLVVKSSKRVDSDDDTSTIDTTLSSEPSFDDSESSLPDPDEFLPDPGEDPASLQATLDSLLPHDQLRRVIKEKKAFHDGWREGPITFLPSYKYDVGTVSLFDSSEKQRAPSWCDRILYRTRKDREEHEQKVKDAEEAKKKDEEMTARGIDHATDDDDVLFSYDPDADGEEPPTGEAGLDYDEYEEDDNEPEEVVTKEGFTDRIQLDIYTSHQRIVSSDHKPIISIFTLDYDAVVPDLKAKVHAEVAKELDRAENEGRPLITLILDNPAMQAKDEHESIGLSEAVDFGDIGYRSRHTASVTIANTGRVPAKFAFVEKPTIEEDPDASSPPAWLSSSFKRTSGEDNGEESLDLGSEVTLEPGETVSGVLEVYVSDMSHVRALNDGRASLEDILVLRVEDGRDHFIPVRASWLPTCFGRSIDELIRIPDGGIQAFLKSRAEKGSSSIPYDLDVHCAAPKELFKLTEAVEIMTARAIADANMIEEHVVPADKPGWPFDETAWLFKDQESRDSQIVALIEALDNDRPLIEALPVEVPSLYRLEVLSEVLLLFLSGLTDGIITAALWAKIELVIPNIGAAAARSSSEVEDDKTSVLDILAMAPNHNIAFVFLTATLSKVVAELAPISRSEAEALTVQKPSRRSLSFRRLTGGNVAADAALARRRMRERRVGEVFGKAVCRVGLPARDKERKAVEEKMRGVLEIFVRRPLEDG